MKSYFRMINYRTKEDYLCSWFENEPDYYNRKVYYIGLTSSFGGYKQLLSRGFVDKRFHKQQIYVSKTKSFIINKINMFEDEIIKNFKSLKKEEFRIFIKNFIESKPNPWRSILEHNFYPDKI